MKEDEMERIISNNLKKLMNEYKIKQYELAKIAGVSESAAGKWILGKSTPRMGAIQNIADHFSLPKSYILEEKPTNLIHASPATVRIPILGSISCGDPILAVENIKGYRYESPDMLPSGDCYYLEANGDSMEPAIPNGSLVLIRFQPEVETGEIAAVLLNGNEEATLKRVRKQGGNIILYPENSNYDPILVDADNPAKIIGKAVSVKYNL